MKKTVIYQFLLLDKALHELGKEIIQREDLRTVKPAKFKHHKEIDAQRKRDFRERQQKQLSEHELQKLKNKETQRKREFRDQQQQELCEHDIQELKKQEAQRKREYRQDRKSVV